MQNHITYWSKISMTDHENVTENEFGVVEQSGVFILDNSRPSNALFFVGKCGGELRIELSVEIKQLSSGTVRAFAKALLFEGTSENTSDLDGKKSASRDIFPNASQILTFRVDNTAEGGDFADIFLQINNTLLNDNNCNSNIRAKADALGVGFTGPALSDINNPNLVPDGSQVQFEHCDIYCSAQTGTHEVHGDIRAKFNSKGAASSGLGLPVTDETVVPDGKGRFNHFFGNGSIYWHPNTGPMEVRGGIRASWARQGWERSRYGYPTSDEMNINQNPLQWYNDFQNGVIFWENDTEKQPKTASLNGGQVRSVFEAMVRDKTGSDPNLNIETVNIINVSDTRKDFTRSGNRIVTFQIQGDYENGIFAIPNPSYTIQLQIAFESDPAPDGLRKCKLFARLHHWHIHTSGIGNEALNRGLREGIVGGLAQPIDFGEVPENVGFLSFKVMQDGGLTLYFRPDLIGGFTAWTAQEQLNMKVPK